MNVWRVPIGCARNRLIFTPFLIVEIERQQGQRIKGLCLMIKVEIPFFLSVLTYLNGPLIPSS